jgi:membrane-associated protein
MVTSLLDRLSELDGIVLLATMLLFAMGEATFVLDLIVPGEVAMVLGGAVLAEQDTPIVAGMAAAAIGAILGDSLSFLAGATLGTRLVERWSYLQRHAGPSIERAREYFGRRGGIVIVVGRFVGALRAVVPFVAATSGMSYKRFLWFDVPAAIAWGCLTVGLGAAFGRPIARAIDRLDWWTTIALAALIAGWLLFRWWKARRTSRHAT